MAGVRPAGAGERHWPGLLLALAGAGVAMAAAFRIGEPRLPPLLAATMLVGAVFVVLDFGFSGGFRAFLRDGDGRALGASCLVPAIAALVVVPVGTLVEGYGRYVAPVGLPLLAGAAIFGIGMQLSNACGSGTLIAAGQGSRRTLVTLPFFAVGSVLGSLLVPAAMAWPGVGSLDLADLLGPWGGLAATEAGLLLLAILVLRGARPAGAQLRAAAVTGLLAALIFIVAGEPWGITMGLTLWGAQGAEALGMPLGATAFWSDPGMADLLDGPLLALNASIGDVGLLLGALLAAAATGRLRHRTPIGRADAVAAALGGLLMGIGARLAFGCNIGAFLGGTSSGSLHGFAWFAAVLPGCWLGLRLRPLFGLP